MRVTLIIVKRPLLLSAMWAFFIFVLCATPGQYIPTTDWLELLSFDKLVHVSVFFILTSSLLLCAWHYQWRNAAAWWLMVGAILYGMSLEWMQAHWFSNRSADVWDMVANSLGCLLALFMQHKLKAWRQHILSQDVNQD